MTWVLVAIVVLAITVVDLVCYAKTPFEFRMNFWWRVLPLSGFVLYYLHSKDYHHK